MLKTQVVGGDNAHESIAAGDQIPGGDAEFVEQEVCFSLRGELDADVQECLQAEIHGLQLARLVR